MKSEFERVQKEILEKRELGLKIREPHLRGWYDNINIFVDQIFVQKRDYFVALEDLLKRKARDVRFIEAVPSTIILNPYHLLISSFISIPADFLVTPLSNDIECFTASNLAEQILNTIVAPKLNEIKLDLISTMLITSRTLVKVYYDTTIGDVVDVPVITTTPGKEDVPLVVNGIPLKDPETGLPIFHKVYKGVPQFETKRQGDIGLTVISPLNYIIDPMCLGSSNALSPSPNQAKWLIHFFVVDKKWCEEHNIPFENSDFKNTKLGLFFSEFERTELKSECALYQEYWEIPLKSNGYQGRIVKLLNDKVIDIEPLPKWCQRKGVIPFVDFSDDPNPFSWYNKSIISRVARLQRRYVEAESQIYEVAKKVGKIRVCLQRGGGEVEFREVEDDVIDEIIAYGGAQPPVQVIMKDIPELLLRYLDLILRDIQLITLHDPRFPIQSNRTASELAMTLETDEQKLSTIKYMFLDKYAKIGEYALEVIKENYNIGRSLKLLNDFSFFETIYFHPEMISYDYKIRIDIGNPFYMTRAGQFNFVTRMLNLGIFEPLELLEFFYGSNIFATEVFLDLKRAGEENFRLYVSDKMLKNAILKIEQEKQILGEQITELPEYKDLVMGKVEPFDNHIVHLKAHRKFTKKYYNYLTSYGIQKVIDHIQEHLQIIQQQALPMIQTKKGKKGETEELE